MGILDNHQKQEIRFQNGDLIMYNPTDIQIEEIKNILSEVLKVDDNLDINGDLTSREIRFITRELTNIGNEIDNLTDEELLDKLNNGDRQLTLLFREIEKFAYEICEDMSYTNEQSIKFINSYINIINSKSDEEKMKEKINRLLKKHKIGVNYDEIVATGMNKDKINELINKSKVK